MNSDSFTKRQLKSIDQVGVRASQDDETSLIRDEVRIIDLDPNNLTDNQILQIDLSNFEEPKRCSLLLYAQDEEAISE